MQQRPQPQIVRLLREGGFYDRVLAAGSELDRVKEYLRRLAGERPARAARPDQAPTYPCFPELRHAAFHDDGHDSIRAATVQLEAAFPTILAEAQGLPAGSALRYRGAPGPIGLLQRLVALIRPRWSAKGWSVFLLSHMGVRLEAARAACPRTLEVLEGLPRVCLDYPWGDALLSNQAPSSALPPHYSVDNLRVRAHLGLEIPAGAGIRVGGEERRWEAGRCLWFEDSILHEVWNHGTTRRQVLIVDLWHPDLTELEIRALTAGFRKKEVRRLFLFDRLKLTDAPASVYAFLEAELERQDDDEAMREFWDPGS